MPSLLSKRDTQKLRSLVKSNIRHPPTLYMCNIYWIYTLNCVNSTCNNPGEIYLEKFHRCVFIKSIPIRAAIKKSELQGDWIDSKNVN